VLYFSIRIMAKLPKIVPSLLLCIAVLPVVFSIYIQTSETILHYRMREELEKSNLVTISVPASQLHWTHNGREAVIREKMFDVRSFSVEGDMIKLTGLFDEDEDALIAQLNNQQTNNPDAAGSTLTLQLFSFFSWIQNNEQAAIAGFTNRLLFSPTDNAFLQGPVLALNTPPPEAVLV
jgi:hypothetical protein